MPLFGKSQKSPAEVVKALKEAVNALERGEKKVEKVLIIHYFLVDKKKIKIIYFTRLKKMLVKILFT